jgi:hypothetical protein
MNASSSSAAFRAGIWDFDASAIISIVSLELVFDSRTGVSTKKKRDARIPAMNPPDMIVLMRLTGIVSLYS